MNYSIIFTKTTFTEIHRHSYQLSTYTARNSKGTNRTHSHIVSVQIHILTVANVKTDVNITLTHISNNLIRTGFFSKLNKFRIWIFLRLLYLVLVRNSLGNSFTTHNVGSGDEIFSNFTFYTKCK